MFIKLGIIIGIVILGGMIFYTEIDELFPTTSATVVDSLKDDVTNLGSKTTNSVEKRIDESIDKIVSKTGDTLNNEISQTENKITTKVSEAKESSQKIINEEISSFNPIESIQNIFTDDSNLPDSESSINDLSRQESTIDSTNQNHLPIIYDTLSLSTKQLPDNNILLQYLDSSGKTKNANVKIRTDQKEIFSGTFFTSMFETTVNDASGISYFVDLIVEHENYGTITSSVFNPGDSPGSKIHGIFLQS